MPTTIRTREVTEGRLLLEGNSYLYTTVFECKPVNVTDHGCFTFPPNPTLSIRLKGII